MALTAQSRNVTTTSPSPAGVDHPFRPRRLTLGVAALVAGMAAASTCLVLASGSNSPARPAETSTSVPPAYAPGGSVYNQQVPALGRETESIPVPPAYAPGGSVYNQQVPRP